MTPFPPLLFTLFSFNWSFLLHIVSTPTILSFPRLITSNWITS